MKLIFLLMSMLLVFNLWAQDRESGDFLYDGSESFSEIVLKQSKFKTITVTDQVPDTCTRRVVVGHDEVCENQPRENCQTIPGDCRNVARQVCHDPAPVCREITRQECRDVPREECRNEPRRVCTDPSPVCRNVPREVCENVPRRHCSTPSPVCRDVQEQVCTNGPEVCENVPREVCRPGERTCRRICDENSPRCMQCEAGPRVCTTENNRVCRPGQRQCRTETRRECSTPAPVCTTTNERVCRTENERVCHTPAPDCRTVNERVCNTRYERECRNVPDRECHQPPAQCRTVYDNVCDPDRQQCHTTWENVCRDVPRYEQQQYACTRPVERQETVLDHILTTKAALVFKVNQSTENVRELFVFSRINDQPKMEVESSGVFLIFAKTQVGEVSDVGPKEKLQVIGYTLELEPVKSLSDLEAFGIKNLNLSKESFSLKIKNIKPELISLKVTIAKLKFNGRVQSHVMKDQIFDIKDLSPNLVGEELNLSSLFASNLKKGKYRIEIKVEIKKDVELLNANIVKPLNIQALKKVTL